MSDHPIPLSVRRQSAAMVAGQRTAIFGRPSSGARRTSNGWHGRPAPDDPHVDGDTLEAVADLLLGWDPAWPGPAA